MGGGTLDWLHRSQSIQVSQVCDTHDEGEVEEVEEGDADGKGDVEAEVQADVVRHHVVLQVPVCFVLFN
jgi:hypothetical protein